jgi:hypothetical protein
MPSGHDAHLALVGKGRALVAILRRHLRQRGGDVELRDCRRRGSYALRLGRCALAHVREQLLFERQDFLFGIEHFALIIL